MRLLKLLVHRGLLGLLLLLLISGLAGCGSPAATPTPTVELVQDGSLRPFFLSMDGDDILVTLDLKPTSNQACRCGEVVQGSTVERTGNTVKIQIDMANVGMVCRSTCQGNSGLSQTIVRIPGSFEPGKYDLLINGVKYAFETATNDAGEKTVKVATP